MATPPRILVEAPTFQNQRIGVASVYGGSQTAASIARGADQLSAGAFRIAAENAERSATEIAQSVSQADLMAIDPSTGAPVALSQMGNMGRIGSEAYRRVINARFQQSIENEIRNQATILAAQYEDDPDGVALYTTAMSDYVSSMSQNATGQWQTFIEEAGTSYINRTRAAITASQMRASRARLAEAGRRANKEALSAFEASIAVGGPAALGLEATRSDNNRPASVFNPDASGSGVANEINQSVRVGLSDSIEADVISPVAMEGWTLAQREAALRGMTTHYVSQLDMAKPETVNQIARLRYAIGSGDIVSAMRLAPELAPYASFLLQNAESQRDYDTFANRVLGDAMNLAELESKETQLAAESQALQLSLQWQQQAQDAAFNTQAAFRDSTTNQITQMVQASITELNQVRASIPTTTNERQREALEERVNLQVNAIRDGLFDNLVSGLPNQDETDRMRAAFASRNPALLSDEERVVYDAIASLERFDVGIFDKINTEFGSYRESGGRFAQAEVAAAERIRIQNEVLPFANDILLRRGQDIDQTVSGYIQSIEESAGRGLQDGERNSALTLFNTNAAQAHLYAAFELARTPEEALALREYAEGTRSFDGLNPESVRSIDQARLYAGSTGNTSTMPTAVGRAIESANRRMAAERDERERIDGMNLILSGAGNSNLATHRDHAQSLLEQDFRSAITESARIAGQAPRIESLPPDIWTNPQYLQDPALNSVFSRVYNTPGYMPSSLHDVFSAIGTGAMVQGLDVALSHWNQIRTINGMRNPAIRGLSESEIGMLNMMSAAVPYFGEGPDGRVRFEEAMIAHSRLMNSEPFQKQVETYLGKPLSDFLNSVDGYQILSGDQQAAIRSLSAHMISMSITAPQIGSGDSWLRDQLEKQISEATPDSGGIVREFASNGMLTTRTRFNLDNFTSGYTDDFLSLVNQDIRELSNAAPLNSIGGGSIEELQSRLRQSGGMESYVFSTLVPAGEDSNGGVTYYVYEINTNTGSVSPVIRTDEGGEGLPLMVSTSEPRFRTLVLGKQLNQQLDQERRGDAYLELLGEALSPAGEGLELMGLPPEMREAR